MGVQVNVSSSMLIDLSDPNNPMIQSSEDAAQVDVEGEKLWLSKSLLGWHSPYFKALFNSNPQEKQYELKEIKLDEFLHFFALLNGVHVEPEYYSIEYLTKLGDHFQCPVVISHCRHLLLQSEIPVARKLKLVDRLGLYNMAEKLLLKMDYVSLKKVVDSGEMLGFSAMTNMQIMACMNEFLR